MCTIGRVKAFGSDECRLSGKDTLSGVSKGQVLLLITVEPHRHLSGLAAVIQHQGRRVGLREQQKEDDTRSSPEADKFPLLRRQLWVWTLQLARSQWRKKNKTDCALLTNVRVPSGKLEWAANLITVALTSTQPVTTAVLNILCATAYISFSTVAHRGGPE